VRVPREEGLQHLLGRVLLDDEEAVVGAVDLDLGAGRAAGGDPDLAQPGVGQAIVQEGPVAARHVEHQLLDAVELAVRIVLVERDVELHLLPVAVEHHRPRPRRLPVQLEGGVGDGLAVQVEHHRVPRHEVVPLGEQRGGVVELRQDGVPVVGRDVDRIRPELTLIKQIGTRRGRARP